MREEAPEPREARPRGWGARLAAAPGGPRFRPFSEILLPVFITAVLTVWVRLTNFDLEIERWIYRIGGDSWALGEHPFWKGLYYAGTIPLAIIVLAATLLVALSWAKASLRPWRRVLIFIILSGVVGPGVVTNLILKESWGRARPRELIEFGGRSEFEPVLSFEPTSLGMSFPCGHATTGFFFLAGYFLLRRHCYGIALSVAFGSLVLGGLMGVARMAQGAHFFSDVIWAALVCWMVSLVLYYAMGLDRRLLREGGTRHMPWWAKTALSLMAVGVVGGVLLATPYQERREYHLLQTANTPGAAIALRLQMCVGEVEILPGEQFRILSESQGHGVPTSKIGHYFEEGFLEDGTISVIYAERLSGWFREIGAVLRVELPWDRVQRLEMKTGDAQVRIRLGDNARGVTLRLLEGRGLVTVDRSGQELHLKAATVDELLQGEGDSPGPRPRRSAAPYRLNRAETFQGELRVVSEP